MDTILPKSTIHGNLCLFLHRMAMLKAIYQLCKCSLTRDSRFYVLQLHKVYFPGHVYVDFLGILMLWLLVWICPPKNLCKALLKARNQNGYRLTTYSDCLALRRANLYTVFPKGMDTEKKIISQRVFCCSGQLILSLISACHIFVYLITDFFFFLCKLSGWRKRRQ